MPPLPHSSSLEGPDWELVMGREICGEEQGSSPQLLYGQSMHRGEVYECPGSVGPESVCIRRVGESLKKQKRQTDHKSDSSEGSPECFLADIPVGTNHPL